MIFYADPLLAEQPIAVPSGQTVTLTEVLIDDTPGETWVRFRFIAPAIARETAEVAFDAAALDMAEICVNFALPYLMDHDLQAARIVISLADRQVAFGAADPDATQFFETYRPEDETCIWEAF